MFKCLTIIILLTKVCVASNTELNWEMNRRVATYPNDYINNRIVNSYYSPSRQEPISEPKLNLQSVVLIYGEVPINQEYTMPPTFKFLLKEDGRGSLSSNLSSSNLSEREKSLPDDHPIMSYANLFENLFKKRSGETKGASLNEPMIEMKDMSARASLTEQLLQPQNDPEGSALEAVQQVSWWNTFTNCLTNCLGL